MALNDCRSAVFFGSDPRPGLSSCPVNNKHKLWLCYGCHPASLWGPCEHAYCCMEHEGQSSTTVLPKAKPKGRPRKTMAVARPTPHQIIPGSDPAHEPALLPPQSRPSNAPSPKYLELGNLLRSASLGHLLNPMREQGVTIPALRRFSFSDFFYLFNTSVGESHALMEALCPSVSAPSRLVPERILPCASVPPSSGASRRVVPSVDCSLPN